MDYPTLDEVYDLSTEDLKKIQLSLRNNLNGHEDLLEAVTLQIQQRKALEYFSQLCKADNPYAKKVAAFNQQFLKLAAQAIEKNHNERIQGIGSNGLPNPQQIQSKNSNNVGKKLQTNNLSQFSSQYLISQSKSRTETESQTRSIKSSINQIQDARSTTTNGSASRSLNDQYSQKSTSRIGEVKLNLGKKKGSKDKMKELIKNKLASTLMEQDSVIKRNNLNSPNQNVNQKKYHIPGQKHENLHQADKKKNTSKQAQVNSQKSIKNQKSEQKQKVNKGIKASSQDNKKIKEVANRMKQQSKKGQVKLPKINQYKDLVQMVKDQQQMRKNKINKTQNTQKLPQIENHSSTRIEIQQEYTKDKEDVDKLEQKQFDAHEKLQQTQMDGINEEEVINEKQKFQRSSTSQKIILTNDIIKEQQMQESLSPQKITQQNTKKQANNSLTQYNRKDKVIENQREKVKDKVEDKDKDEVKEKEKVKGKDKDKDKEKVEQKDEIVVNKQKQCIENQNLKSEKYIQNTITNMSSNNEIVIKNRENKKINKEIKQIENENERITQKSQQIKKQLTIDNQVDYSKKLIEQIEKQQENQFYFFNQDRSAINQNQEYDPSNNINQQVNHTAQSLSPNSVNRGGQKEKKCYSQQYWTHIREEAELKIKRYKQQKEYEQKKQLTKQPQHGSDQKSQSTNSQDEIIINNYISNNKDEQPVVDKQIAIKNEQLIKMKKQLMKKTNKKVMEAVAIPKIIRPKPDFNYLSVYPTFNHIFSVMYLKPVHQALNDIPNLMRDIKTMLTTHIQHFSNKSNFKPAIFLPFDHNGAFQLTDPKQLIAHAQETYIDLKVMIERVQNFNNNLHGEFNNAQDERYYRVVKTKQQVYDIITTSFMRRKGWKELPHGCSLRSSWNLFWSWSKPDIDLNKLLVWQKINHFPFNKNLSRKDLLYKNLDAFRKTYKISMNFLPLTFNLPKQFSQLSAKFHQEQVINRDNNYWIMKPIGKSRGRGIKVVSSLSQLNFTDNIVVQKYILTPMLIDGYKFDMRIYVLVTSFHPLQAFVYREGFARLSTQKYTLDAHSIKNTFVHLTNFAINKNNVSSNTMFSGGSKISLKTLKDKITRMGYSFSNIWLQVHQIIVKSLLGCSVSVPSFPTAFELFGYDIMVDQQSNCHLIEINASPSLQRSYMLDQIVKQNLIDDIIDIVDPPEFDKKQLIEVLSQRIQSIANNKKITTEEDLIGLARILKYKPVRKVGEKPNKMGLFEVVAPSDTSRELESLIKVKSGANNPLNID